MKKLFVCVTTLLVACSLSATVHKVKASDGADVLKTTIAEAAAGDTVLVQEGTFTGNFTMKDGVQVRGGWNSLFTSQKDYATILDANADGRVLNQPAAFTTLTVWSNFTIQNGKLTTALADQGAAGVFLNVKGRVQDCLIQNNVVDVPSGNAMGGGVSCNSGTADPDTVAYNCIIKNNSATHGGGVRVNGKGVVIYKCVIEGNQTTNNAAGGVHLHNGSHLINCIVRNNKANGDTGGIRLTGGNVSSIINCLIVGNEATSQVGGIGMEGNLANIINCTIVGNKQNKAGATASLSGVKVNKDKDANGTLFVNNIIWGNITGDTIAPQGVYYISKYDKAKGQRSYNAIIGQKGDDDATGTTSLILTKENPGFADPENGDFTLVDGSKLIDFGSDAANTLPTDLAGNVRIQGKAIDLGCYEAASKHVFVGQDLQKALDLAAKGDTLLVQAGTFVGNFVMRNGVNVSGGWNADFTEQTDYATILDGDAKGRVLNQEATFAVSTIWENLTIQNGGATEALGDKGGFGVYLRGNGGLRHCLVQNNKFTGATGESNGGGVRVDGADAKFVALEDCWIKGNQGTHAGGVCLGKGTMINCIVEENTTTNNATGGVTVQDGSFLLNSIIRNNNPKGDFGGVRMRSTTPSTVANCLIMGNVAGTEDAKKTVGGIGINDGVHYVYNNTIVGNTQTSTSNVSRCGLRINVGAGAVIANNIVWGNIAGTEVQADQVEINGNYKSGQAENFINNAVVIPADFGTNTILLNAENPGFFAPESGDYTLADGSALIDAGADAYAQGDIDLVGNLRIQGKAIDLGCYEAASKYVLVGQDLQDALDNAKKGDTIYVQAGTFVGNFIMRNGVNVSGGWNEDFTEQTPYGTILDGDAKGRVLTQNDDFDVLTVWDNVTIQNGKVEGNGGGVYMLWKSLLKHCLIQNNIATGEGGGVKHNKDDHSSDVVLENCVITGNTAKQGGGLWIRSTALNCVIDGNQTTTGPGGGVVLSWARLYNCQVTNNISGEDAGGVRMYGGGCVMVNCLVAKNYAKGHDDYKGKVGGVCIEKNLGAVINCTIVDNDQLLDSTDKEYCGVRVDASSGDNDKIFSNNIIYGNKAGGVVQDQQISYSICKYNNSSNNAIYGSVTGDYKSSYINLKEVDPKFNEDYTLSAASPLINAGADVTGSSFYQAKDLAGNDRVQKEIIDLGCFESAYDTPDGPVTGLVNTTKAAKANKMVVNGQLIVVKDGATYNVLGVKL